ncbi:polyribonucleotide nucleotidyltransferase [Dolosigranulum pigrum]|uniref:polyribonucleotide nucleotidyltransferase n=1 Tax=Dolosigranulum pigrum TaxID=29394 RepID=UPI001AD862AB|nr:polyribonucleotide nucleotidyltransferase [Dolosigranulum pigrum]QTJ35046.1 polyribonucleotide nucleotidyltransferase [Dolosigranulum pigrum]QTJ40211.1 polyribonucleotide nucleotidyltransferase [Dolosigranulum pigrum]QTJ48694.1 polyribonucleotide nucleotidyltransferase [Dolosigranulum pigrum]
MLNKQEFTKEFAGRQLTVEVGQVARQANAAATIRYDDTVILSAVVNGDEPSTLPFFPLMVNYEEKMYSVGKIPGGFIKREGRPSEHATLTARLIDRPIRPMFPEGFKYETQIYNTVLSVNKDATPEMTAMFGSSLTLGLSTLPFNGPIAGVQVGRVDGEFVINPTEAQLAASDIDLIVAGTKDAINMVESGAQEVSEADMLEALLFGHEAVKELCAFQDEIIAEIGQEKMEVELILPDADLKAAIEAEYSEQMIAAVQNPDKMTRAEQVETLTDEIVAAYEEKFTDDDELDSIMKDVKQIIKDMEKAEVRRLITEDKVRPDGRDLHEIRDLDSEVAYLPRAHGSGLFTRGQTQALSVLTLGPLAEHQVIDGLSSEEEKRFIHHYNFPSYSVGETGRPKSPGRREIGHGALGARALEAVIPDEEDFPYTIRLVAEVLESNGSSSQASICAGSLALMDGGVPIKAPVAGIAMGLVMDSEDQYTVLTDIQGLEDHLGDMDFKVAGTAKGITALQMDIKIEGITRDILVEALESAKNARLEILNNMMNTIGQPREQLSEYAPKVQMIQIKPDQIKIVIGKGGDQINQIIDETGVKIDIEEDGKVSVYGEDQAMIDRAIEIIEELTEEVEVGKIYKGKVVRIENFGAFVEVIKGTDGLVHISELADGYVKNVTDVVKMGEEIDVLVTEIDNMGRVNLSRKQAIEKKNEQ